MKADLHAVNDVELRGTGQTKKVAATDLVGALQRGVLCRKRISQNVGRHNSGNIRAMSVKFTPLMRALEINRIANIYGAC